MGVLTLDPGSDEEILPVFSFEEEAETFLRLGAAETDDADVRTTRIWIGSWRRQIILWEMEICAGRTRR